MSLALTSSSTSPVGQLLATFDDKGDSDVGEVQYDLNIITYATLDSDTSSSSHEDKGPKVFEIMIRIGKTKVRTGCITCKRRRVKCDETRPSCNRCVKAGKSCEGYANDPSSGQGSEPVKFVVYTPRNPSPVLSEQPNLDWSERRAFSYYQDRTALELAGPFQPDFWLATILPLAREHGSVRHALIALSSMHEHYSGVDHFSPARSVDFALNHYGKAMRELMRFNHAQVGQNLDRALVLCALFSAFESLQGQYHEACNHAVSGIRILAEEQRNASASPNQPRLLPSDDLARFFVAMGRQILEIGGPNFLGPKPKFYRTGTTTAHMPYQFTSHEHALLHVESLLAELFEYVERAETLAYEGPVPDDVAQALLAEFHAIKPRFEEWQAAFERLSAVESNEYSRETPESCSSAASSPPSAQHSRTRSAAFLILRAYQALMVAFLARVESNDEAVFKDHGAQFWTALDAVEEFIQCTSTLVRPVDGGVSPRPPPPPSDWSTSTSTSTSTSISATNVAPASQSLSQLQLPQQPPPVITRPTFSLALGVVPTLFLIATRSRDLALRDKALSLLRSCNRREGLWDSHLAASVVDRVIDLRTKARSMSRAQLLLADADLLAYIQTTEMPSGREPNASLGVGGEGAGLDDVVDFKLLDITFLPRRRCALRYAFAARQATTQGTPTSMLHGDVSGHFSTGGAGARCVREFCEELRWEQ
ncbi:hypothetical protein AYO21_06028 [Fonsecaea monophora]|uniref:Zn(2)-C6 fungal-type domain-containing protein n=1 Tax=Fonsecaea monophora TaxID=254056 RepID=A0A177F6A5_9EURO|nr:hypothetical protein AYO21_06028 [Fonsecaea monophora]OAG39753.1 hypothetical protein AYO21_06028 [Fonsecaea monophora]